MANPNIKVTITADDNASKKLKNLDDQVGKTEGGMGKLGKAAAVGGAALVALGIKSVMAFEDLGLTVGKFADATGATTEEASRLIEVAGDIGISSETLQSSIGKMSKQLGANEEAFKSYGIEVAKNADGTTNVNETFLASVDAINAIQDPLKKAEVAAKVFGKGYQGMAELLGKSSDEIREDLAAVSDAKVFDDKKVKDARDMREAFDSIVDAGQDLILTIGKSLAPVITKLAPILVKVVEAAAPAAEALGEVLVSALEVLGPIIEGLLPVIQQLAKALTLLSDVVGKFKPTGLTKGIEEAGVSLDLLKQKAIDAGLTQEQFQAIIDESARTMATTGDATQDLATMVETVTARFDEFTTSTAETDRETRKLGDAEAILKAQIDDATEAADRNKKHNEDLVRSVKAGLDDIQRKWDELTGTIDANESWANLQLDFMALKTTGEEALTALADGTEDARTKSLEYQVAVDQQKKSIIDYAQEVLKIPPERITNILAAVDAGDLERAELLLANLTRNRNVSLSIEAKMGAGYSNSGLPRFATGGVVGGPTGAPVPALVHGGETVRTPEQEKALNGGGGMTIESVTVVVQSMPSPNELVAILSKYSARNGKAWMDR